MTIQQPPAKLIAAVMGLSAFLAALIPGMIIGNPGVITLSRALLCMAVGYAVGRVLGWVAEVAAGEFLTAYQESRPLPEQLAMPSTEEAGVAEAAEA